MTREPRVLLYDIENTPFLGWSWGPMWDCNMIKIERDWYILCFAYKWLGEKQVHYVGIDQFPADAKKTPQSDYHVVKALHDLMSEADIVVAHNGNKHDQKKAQARMIAHGMEPPVPYKQIDTLRAFKAVGAFTSAKLNDLCAQLDVGHKEQTGGIDTWWGCMANDPASWRRMRKYNIQDVRLLEEAYLIIRPWIKTHPHMGRLRNDMTGCPKCGVSALDAWKRGYDRSTLVPKIVLQCRNCKGYFRERLMEPAEKGKARSKYVN